MMLENIYTFQIVLLLIILSVLISILISACKNFKVIILNDVNLADFACCMGIFIGLSISLIISYLFLLG